MKTKNNLLLVKVFFIAGILVVSGCESSFEISPQATLIPTSEPTVLPTVADLMQTETSQPAETPAEEPMPAESAPDVTVFPNPALFDWALVASGFSKPTDLVDPADGSGRLLVLEQGGIIRVIANGQVQDQLFIDLTDKVGSGSSEQGLLGIALDPDFADNGIFYLNYTDIKGNTVVSRFRSKAAPLTGDSASEEQLMFVDQPFANHNGGDLEFGPDGMLYIALGDGGSGGDPRELAQNTDTLLGKILRIDVRGKTTFTIPADNPFASGSGAQEIWAYGLRNPWRFSFDPQTGNLFIADVGQNIYEEINFLPAGSPAGANFGWNFREGMHEFKGTPPANLTLIDPVFEYDHSLGCSVTGGFVYRGQDLPEFNGMYLFGDYCTGIIWGMLRGEGGQWLAQRLFQVSGNISSFGQDSSGELYLLDHRTGSIFRLVRK